MLCIIRQLLAIYLFVLPFEETFFFFLHRNTVHNKILLEEQVADLRQKCASSDERIQRLVQLEAQQALLERNLGEWIALIQDFCPNAPDDKASLWIQEILFIYFI